VGGSDGGEQQGVCRDGYAAGGIWTDVKLGENWQPVANLSVDIGHKLAFNMGWNYYQYNEGSFVGPTAPRYFHANNLTESLRYSF
jgi:hypothetical protein